MLTKEQLIEQLRLQDQMNRTVNPEWLDASYPWHRAIMVEAVEALDHYGWKWWKKQEPNYEQIRIELVDIWHFVLSDVLEDSWGKYAVAAEKLLERSNVPPLLNHLATPVLFQRLVGGAADFEFSHGLFEALCTRFGLTGGGLHRLYLAKNVLNLFRQSNGYKEGTYTKVWGDREDNEVLSHLMSQHPNASADELTHLLALAYSATNPQKETA